MTSYWPTIGQLKCILACNWKYLPNILVFAYHWSFVLYNVIFIATLKSFITVSCQQNTSRFNKYR